MTNYRGNCGRWLEDSLPFPLQDKIDAITEALVQEALEQAHGTCTEVGRRLGRHRASWPEDCPQPSALLATADSHLSSARRAGRGRACLGSEQVVVF